MASHTRTRTGCWTCREAGYKCDEQKPSCGRCIRLKVTCKGYGVKLKWKTTITNPATEKHLRHKRKRTPVDYKAATDSVSFSTVTPIPAVLNNRLSPGLTYGTVSLAGGLEATSDLSYGDRRLLHYWIHDLSPLISVAPRNRQGSPFQLHLTAMTCTPNAFRSTVLSMAANHLALVSNDRLPRIHAYRHQQDAICMLQRIIQDPVEVDTEHALATVLMMQVSARLFGTDVDLHVANHLTGAKAMIARRGGLRAWSATSTARLLLSLFAYHDILTSVSRSSKPLVDHSSDFEAVEGVSCMRRIAKVLHLVARISELRHMRWKTDTAPANAAESDEFNALGISIQSALRDLAISTTDSLETTHSNEPADVALTTEAYRHAAFIYLYRVWLGIGAPNPTTLHHVQQCLVYLQQVEINSPLVSSHVWPLWTAGCEAVTLEHRSFVRERYQKMVRIRKFPSLKRNSIDIEDVWAYKDDEQLAGGKERMAKVDCIQVVLNRKGREVDLA